MANERKARHEENIEIIRNKFAETRREVIRDKMDEKATNSEKELNAIKMHGKNLQKDSDYLMQLRQDLIKKQFLAQSSKKYHQSKKAGKKN